MSTISGREFFGNQPGMVVQSTEQFSPEQPQEENKTYKQRLGESYKRRGEAVISDISRPAEILNKGGSSLKATGAAFQAGFRTVGNVAGAAFDPITEAISPLLKPLIQKIISSKPGIEADIQNIQAWAQKHPELVKDLGAGFNIATLGGGRAAEPIAKDMIAGGVKNVAKPLAPVGRALKATGRGAYGITVPMEEATSKALLNYQAKTGGVFKRMLTELKGADGKPITEADTAARFGLMGTEREIGIQAKRFADQLWNESLAPKLEAAKEIIDMRAFLEDVRKEIIRQNPGLDRKNQLLNAFDSFADSYKNVTKIGGTKLQEYKSSWTQNLPEATWKDKPIAGALKEVKKIASEKARPILYEATGGNKDYIDWGNLQSVIEAGVKAPTGDAAKRSFSRNVWELIMDKAITPVATMAGKVLYRTGEGLEFLGNIGAKRVGDIIESSDDLLDAGAKLTKDLPMGMSIKKVGNDYSGFPDANGQSGKGLYPKEEFTRVGQGVTNDKAFGERVNKYGTPENEAKMRSKSQEVRGVKQIDEPTKKELIEAIDYIRVGRKKAGESLKMEQSIRYLADKYGITDKTLGKVADKFERLVEDTKTSDFLPGTKTQ